LLHEQVVFNRIQSSRLPFVFQRKRNGGIL
jgi:hypothetical protein